MQKGAALVVLFAVGIDRSARNAASVLVMPTISRIDRARGAARTLTRCGSSSTALMTRNGWPFKVKPVMRIDRVAFIQH